MLKKILMILPVLALVPVMTFAQTSTGSAGTQTPLVAPSLRINSNGTILARNLIVTGIEQNTIRATFMYGGFQMPMVLQTSTSTEFIGRNGSRENMQNNLVVGDTISFSGVVRLQENNPVIHATVVRNWTPDNMRGGGSSGVGTSTATSTTGTSTNNSNNSNSNRSLNDSDNDRDQSGGSLYNGGTTTTGTTTGNSRNPL